MAEDIKKLINDIISEAGIIQNQTKKIPEMKLVFNSAVIITRNADRIRRNI